MAKILLVGSAHPLRGGIASLNERLALAFQQQGHEVEILSFSLQYPSFLFPGSSQFTNDPAPKNLKISSLLNSINPLNWLWIGQKYRQKNFDLVIFRFWLPFMSPCLGTIARILKKKHTKVIAITDNVIPHEKRFGDKVFTKYFLSACEGFLAMSKSVLTDLRQFEPKKPQAYCPHPIYDNYGEKMDKTEARKKLKLDENGKYVLFFGFIRAYKGLDLLLEAFGNAIIDPEVKLIIAGEYYENPEKYEALISKYQLENRIVRAMNFIANEDVSAYFCAADLIAQPYKTATQSGVSQIAYHFDKAMLVTDVGGLAELIPDQIVGYVVKPDSQAIAKAIADFYEQKKEVFFVENVKIEKQKFAWERMTESLLGL
ncbi:MAG: glycosyltransferase [Bacteroidetes bacterium]|nr:MAG: glycosyltransferase [Bacteroidota bacterium]